MKKIFSAIATLLLIPLCHAAPAATPIEDYIARWAPTAVREMYRSGVPASITLAQGILESRYGLSPLAAEGNNHFGIKCHKDWTGKKQYYDDDAKGECFRVYESADESFRDHSDFLRYRDRYKFLFELKTTDYKSWAYGLKKAGYATDPGYPTKLIKYIEDYKLYEYDSMSLAEAEKLMGPSAGLRDRRSDTSTPSTGSGTAGTGAVAEQGRSGGGGEASDGAKVANSASSKTEKKAAKKAEKEAKKAEKAAKKAQKKAKEDDEELSGRIPDSPLSLEEPKKIDKSSLEEFKFSLSREAYSKNGVPFVTAMEGETYQSIATRYGLFLKEILKYNDLKAPEELLPGTVVYLQAKKNQSQKGLDMFIVDDDSTSLRDICQRFGVKMSSVQKMNGLGPGYEPREGDTIVLRGKKRRR